MACRSFESALLFMKAFEQALFCASESLTSYWKINPYGALEFIGPFPPDFKYCTIAEGKKNLSILE